MGEIFVKTLENSFLDHFLNLLGPPDQTGLFFKIRDWSLFLLYDYLYDYLHAKN